MTPTVVVMIRDADCGSAAKAYALAVISKSNQQVASPDGNANLCLSAHNNGHDRFNAPLWTWFVENPRPIGTRR